MIAALLSATGTMRDAAREPVEVSVRDVVIDPYTVDGKLVRLYGSLHLRRDGDARYWLEADNKPSGESRAVTVHYSSPAPQPDDAANGSYVALEGIFYAAKPKRRGWRWEPAAPGARFEGALVNARRVQTR